MTPFQMDLALFVFAGAVAFGLGFFVHRGFERWGFIDRPNERSSHVVPTVRGGGVGMVAAVMLSSAAIIFIGGGDANHASQVQVLLKLLLAALMVAAISFLDDFRSIAPQWRILTHALAAFAAIWILGWPRLELIISPAIWWKLPAVLAVLVQFFWLAGYTNAFNFMDGIDGLAAGQALITAAGSAILAGLHSGRWQEPPILFSLAVAGAAAGFLPHNFPAARMFMGDVGSAFLGFLLAAQSLWLAVTYGWELLAPLVLLHANFLLDTSITLARRVAKGERWYAPHREHFYQRMVRSGRSHTLATGWEMGLQIAVMLLLVWPKKQPNVLALALVVTVVWACFFSLCERLFNAAEVTGSRVSVRGVPPRS